MPYGKMAVSSCFSMPDYREINRRAWAYLAQSGCDSSRGFGLEQFSQARSLLDKRGWIPWSSLRKVLCLACGGGQQAALFASLGYTVTLADLSPDQLSIDRQVAETFGLDIEFIEADMLDLSTLNDRHFDLVYQAVSACYVPDVRRLYREVFNVLKPTGYYYVEHWNPLQLQLAEDDERWDGRAYRLSRPRSWRKPIPYTSWSEESGAHGETCWHFFHSLTDLIGGLCATGFEVLRFAESEDADLTAQPGSYQHIAGFLPSFFSMLARRRP
jgi:SAM-dependent methyltransferase